MIAPIPSSANVRTPLPLWRRDWLDAYPADVPSSLSYPSAPLSDLLESAALRFPDRPGCTLFGTSLTFRQLADRAHRLAAGLANFGAGPGVRVGMLLPNCPEYIVALQAAWLTGATVLQLSPLMVAEEIERWLRLTECRTVVALDLLAPRLDRSIQAGLLDRVLVASLASKMEAWRGWLYRVERARLRGVVRLLADGRICLFDDLLRTPPRLLSPRIVPEEDVALLAPTGGTTASPKAVMLTHRNLIANALQLRVWSRTQDGTEGVLGVLPFFHAYGLSACLLTGLAKAATVHLHPRFEANAVLNVLERNRVELVPAVPAMLAALNRALARRPRDLSFVRAVISGASALTDPVRREFEQYGPRHVVEGYGLSEASPVTHVNPLGPGSRPGTIGLPVPDTEARIVDEETGLRELPTGEVGELIVRGPQVMKGYFANPEETARALRGGWLYTGDLAKRDRDGYFTIVDRKKDIIKASGFLVYPAEVEEALLRFPGVAEAAVVGEPDAERGEAVKALVVPRVHGAFDVDALRSYCTEHLSKHKRPRTIAIVETLPKNFLGKVLRRQLRG